MGLNPQSQFNTLPLHRSFKLASQINKLVTELTLTASLIGYALAGELIQVKGKLLGRENHSFSYEDGCQACHQGSGKKTQSMLQS